MKDEDSDGYDGDEQLYDDPPLQPCPSIYTTFEQLDKDADTMPGNCRALYSIQALDSLLSAALANYSNIMKNGYDDKFDACANAVVGASS